MNTFQEGCRDLAIGFRQDYKRNIEEIKTFESIFKDKKWSLETRKKIKSVLIELYIERDKNGKRAEYYRALYHQPERTFRTLRWGKSRT